MFNEISGVAISSVPQLIIAWLFVVGGARRCQVELNHYAVHNRLFKVKDKQGGTKKVNLNRWFVEIISTILFIQDYDGYYKDHIGGHHRFNVFCGPTDADWNFLQHLGLKPGMRLPLDFGVLSPGCHAAFLR
ncbi:MAG: hypothetical protein HY836_09835 [Aquabacterium sp.]|uniref:hypothetical protein n=1 Tax=Aquabacterium sp. TaxID=1872578 RepID=UPI0025BEFC14|nr:hypothetical protein [Aquabacterium sp.]MBI5925885.1 hypothetical protein [Aquabacterium sp.]